MKIKILLILFMFINFSCEKINTQECDINNTGTVIVINNLTYNSYAEISIKRNLDDDDHFIETKLLLPGDTVEFLNVPAGDIKIHEFQIENSILFNNEYWNENLTSCEKITKIIE